MLSKDLLYLALPNGPMVCNYIPQGLFELMNVPPQDVNQSN